MATAQELRTEAARHEQSAADSFERCDTDGFVSQWASGLSASRLRRQAEIEEHGGTLLFARKTLLTLDGEATDGRLVQTRFGMRWRLDSLDKWVGDTPGSLRKHGFRVERIEERGPARAILWGGEGRGLSGACSVHVRTIRTDRPKSEGWFVA